MTNKEKREIYLNGVFEGLNIDPPVTQTKIDLVINHMLREYPEDTGNIFTLTDSEGIHWKYQNGNLWFYADMSWNNLKHYSLDATVERIKLWNRLVEKTGDDEIREELKHKLIKLLNKRWLNWRT